MNIADSSIHMCQPNAVSYSNSNENGRYYSRFVISLYRMLIMHGMQRPQYKTKLEVQRATYHLPIQLGVILRTKTYSSLSSHVQANGKPTLTAV